VVDLLNAFEGQALEANLAGEGPSWGPVVKALGIWQVTEGCIGREANAHAHGCYGGRSCKPLHFGRSQERGL